MPVISAASLNTSQAASLLGSSATGISGLLGNSTGSSTTTGTTDLVALSSASLLEEAQAVTGVGDDSGAVDLSTLSSTAVGQLVGYTQQGDVIGAMLGAPSGLDLLV